MIFNIYRVWVKYLKYHVLMDDLEEDSMEML